MAKDTSRGVVDLESLIDGLDLSARKTFYTEMVKGRRGPDGKLEVDQRTGQPAQAGLEEQALSLHAEILNIRALLKGRNADLKALIDRAADPNSVDARIEAEFKDSPSGFSPQELIRREIASLVRLLEARNTAVEGIRAPLEMALAVLKEE